jgi:hypothetical protein
MPRVIVGFGEYCGYRLPELPFTALEELAKRYPLVFDDQSEYTRDHLLVTLGVHAELRRRSDGGAQERRVPTLRELAKEILTKGFQQAI